MQSVYSQSTPFIAFGLDTDIPFLPSTPHRQVEARTQLVLPPSASTPSPSWDGWTQVTTHGTYRQPGDQTPRMFKPQPYSSSSTVTQYTTLGDDISRPVSVKSSPSPHAVLLPASAKASPAQNCWREPVCPGTPNEHHSSSQYPSSVTAPLAPAPTGVPFVDPSRPVSAPPRSQCDSALSDSSVIPNDCSTPGSSGPSPRGTKRKLAETTSARPPPARQRKLDPPSSQGHAPPMARSLTDSKVVPPTFKNVKRKVVSPQPLEGQITPVRRKAGNKKKTKSPLQARSSEALVPASKGNDTPAVTPHLASAPAPDAYSQPLPSGNARYPSTISTPLSSPAPRLFQSSVLNIGSPPTVITISNPALAVPPSNHAYASTLVPQWTNSTSLAGPAACAPMANSADFMAPFFSNSATPNFANPNPGLPALYPTDPLNAGPDNTDFKFPYIVPHSLPPLPSLPPYITSPLESLPLDILGVKSSPPAPSPLQITPPSIASFAQTPSNSTSEASSSPCTPEALLTPSPPLTNEVDAGVSTPLDLDDPIYSFLAGPPVDPFFDFSGCERVSADLECAAAEAERVFALCEQEEKQKYLMVEEAWKMQGQPVMIDSSLR
ncbi:hypothetical protein BKA70DRAFT_1570077 [Coprinopsis sp. MPI-PUGE-AT-0042]|nr:hypothetical protein BKA70DRAFT_1570077 [Coprinopsis sp. MPI-PUGE-AT-0042]